MSKPALSDEIDAALREAYALLSSTEQPAAYRHRRPSCPTRHSAAEKHFPVEPSAQGLAIAELPVLPSFASSVLHPVSAGDTVNRFEPDLFFSRGLDVLVEFVVQPSALRERLLSQGMHLPQAAHPSLQFGDRCHRSTVAWRIKP